MAPAAIHPAPHTQMGRLMVEARRRGLSFEQWWQEAVRPGEALVMVNHPNPPAGAVRWPTDRRDRDAWQIATAEAKEGWRRAYERAPQARPESALAFLADAIGALQEVADRRAADELGEQDGEHLAAA